jgi:hypothetical protein
MTLSIKVKSSLKDLLWVGIFFLVLAAITFPVILLSSHFKFEVNMAYQAFIVMIATIIVQLLRREPISMVVGRLNMQWLKTFLMGLLIGFALMFVPALFLLLGGWITWKPAHFDLSSILAVSWLFVCVAVAEELLFRGFIFQRLMNNIGQWPAQVIIGAYFLLIHLNNPGMTGMTKVFAIINIFLASIMFGLAVIRFKSLSVALGIHFMANWFQGVVLGFAVSGTSQSSLLLPISNQAPGWLTGGEFGLEASLPGLICVIVTIIFLYRLKPKVGIS